MLPYNFGAVPSQQLDQGYSVPRYPGQFVPNNPYVEAVDESHFPASLQDGNGTEDLAAPLNWSGNKRPRRRDLNWNDHKALLKSMYLDKNQKLEDIMEFMGREHDFVATAKQYKERFKLWGWQKNLPYDKALWMVEKASRRKREEDKDTEFVFGGAVWSKQRAEATAKRSKKQDSTSTAMDVDTPLGVSYKTPKSYGNVPPDAPSTIIQESPAADVISIRSSVSDDGVEDGHDDSGLVLSWSGSSKADLDRMFENVQHLILAGGGYIATQNLLHVWEGYKAILGPCHEETSKAAYALATLHAEQAEMDSANRVVDETTRAYVKQFGLDDGRSLQHVLHVVELLNGWNKPSEALAFLARAKDFVQDEHNTRHRKGKTKRQRMSIPTVSTQRMRLLDAAEGMAEDRSPERIDNGLELARARVQALDEAAQPFLLAILQQCGNDIDKLAKQRLKAWTELIKLYSKMDTVWDNLGRLAEAGSAFAAILSSHPWEESKFRSLEVMEALLELAAAFLRAGREDQAYAQFRRATDKAGNLFGPDDERTVWMLISVGLVYQQTKGWNFAGQWFDQALAGAMTGFGETDGITLSLEAAKEKRHFSYINDEGRPFKSIFGVTGITIRPGRLHIE